MSEYRDTLREELRDEEYRYAYAEDFLNTFVATQIKVIREQRDLTQDELAELIGTKQSGISRLENVNYKSWKTETLRKIARALGVRLKISFETFGSLIDDGVRFSADSLQRAEFSEDPVFQSEPAGTREAKSGVVNIARFKLGESQEEASSIQPFLRGDPEKGFGPQKERIGGLAGEESIRSVG
jgi:transcriptional regulator with XRE-family HTH domain